MNNEKWFVNVLDWLVVHAQLNGISAGAGGPVVNTLGLTKEARVRNPAFGRPKLSPSSPWGRSDRGGGHLGSCGNDLYTEAIAQA